MNRAYTIRKYLNRYGKDMLLQQGNWTSAAFKGVLVNTWRKNKSNFETDETDIGKVRSDYYIYIGPNNHDITALSDDRYLICEGDRYLFVKAEAVMVGGYLQFFSGVVKRIWEDDDEIFE